MNMSLQVRQTFVITLFLLLSFTLGACQFSDATVVKGDGNVSTESFYPDPFNTIELQGMFNVYLNYGTQPSVAIETDDNLKELIRTEVKRGVLKIYVERDVMLRPSKLDVYITYTTLEHISIGGACILSAKEAINTGTLTLDTSGAADIDLSIQTPNLLTKISGAGNIKLDGQAKEHLIELSGASNLRAENLITENTKISLSGAGSAHVYASDKLDASISGIGKITYHGDPADTRIQKSGLGAIVNANE